MTEEKLNFQRLNTLSNRLILTAFIAVFLPVLILVCLGAYSLIVNGYSLYFALIFFMSTVVILGVGFCLKKWSIPSKNEQKEFVQANEDWSNSEQKIWQNIKLGIDNKMQQNPDWSELKEASLQIVLDVAASFGKKELEFTLLESLQLIEEVTRRYRKGLTETMPGVDLVKLSQIKFIYDTNQKYGNVAKQGMQIWRIVRLSDPISALTAELRGQVIDHLSQNLQQNAKRALLEEVAKTSIDLYSGRFAIAEAAAQPQKDKVQEALLLEPIRVVIVGQLSAGKSTLVNALTQDKNAEVDILPSTDIATRHQFSLPNNERIQLIDTIGLNGNEKTEEAIFSQLIQADLVLWVVKAAQSSRELDLRLQKKIQAFYAQPKNISRQKPKIIGVLNQVDKLKPVHHWSPPYALAEQSVKAKNICAALEFTSSQLAFDEIYPLALPEERPQFGMDALQKELEKQSYHAKNVQRNRQRTQARKSASLAVQAKRSYRAVKALIKNVS